MKCRACWSMRAELMAEPRWKVWAALLVLAAPVKCRHCFHQFLVPLWAVGRRREEVPAPVRVPRFAGTSQKAA